MVSLYCLTLCLSLLDVVAAAIINVTQDDSPNDSRGRVALSYLGPWSHQQVATCNGADQCPEPFSQTRNGTWSTSLYVQNSRLNDRPPSVSFGFQGTAIYINCVIIPHDILGISADSDMVFMLDGVVTGRFARQSPESGAISLATVLMRDSLLDGFHTLSIQNGAEFENQTHNVSVLALDSIIYTGVTSGFPPLSAPFALAITTLVAHTPLTKLHLAYWDFLYDVSDLCLVLSSCSSTLVELTLEECYISNRGMMVNPIEDGVPPVVHLGALRKLALVNNGNVSLSQLRHIDAPNLRSLSCAFLKDPFQDISPWIPAAVTEFTLDVRDFSERPWFGKSIRPSWLTIIFRLSYHDEPQCFPVLSWIEDCLNQLPFPHVLHRLDIKVLNLLAFSYPFNYPRRAHYEVLHRALQRFHALDRTNLNLHFLFYSVLPPPYDRRDLKAVFGPQLEANKLVVDMTFQKWSNE
ncbi:hypothetical protein EYR40_004449 [Pleurotus pulmonarius]|nr:hypothetical protein EYR40_004449 [Pleurotus pulmonarius]KAF4607147.1 hypothetical protein EYR38_001206 [Pleurotus pulmonarius]